MRRWNSLIAAALMAASFALPARAEEEPQRPSLALMGTVPIYWGEAAGLDEMLNGNAPPHWARGVLEEGFTLAPLDYLSAEALAGQRSLLMAQPRGLSAEENVALDAWVREGGTLLLFADPMMTGESRFHLGDRRRPQDVTLLSPILAHWGLVLEFDPAQPEGPQVVDHFGDSLPVNQRGRLGHVGNVDYCNIPGDGLLAHCVIGEGQAMVVADAAMLDIADPHPDAEPALRWLLGHVFENFGDHAGSGEQEEADGAGNGANPPEIGQGHGHAHHGRSGNPD